MTSLTMTAPEPGELVQVRGEHWVVAQVDQSRQPLDELAATRSPGRTMVTLMNVSGEDVGEQLTLVWEVEPGHRVVSVEQLPQVSDAGWDDPQKLGAFLDAVRWGTVASADSRTLQAPFRAGISIQEYQLAPVAKALAMPRVNLLIADDVGLGKTIEAGLVIQEMLLRHRARRVLVVCPASLTGKWQEEMAQKFGLDFTVLDADALRELRRTHGLGANPFAVFPRVIISLQWLRTPRVLRLLEEVLTPEHRYPGYFDLLVVDEVHHCAPPAPQRGRGYAVDSHQTQAVRYVGDFSQHRLFLSATPHNGYTNSWQALLEMLDPQRFTRGVTPDDAVLEEVMVRRLKDQIRDADDRPRFAPRHPRAIPVDYTDTEREAHRLLEDYRQARVGQSTGEVKAHDLVTLTLKKRLFSSPAAFRRTLRGHADAVHGITSAGSSGTDALDWLDEAAAWDEEPDEDVPGSAAEQELLFRVADLTGQPTADAEELLARLLVWCERYSESADSKALALVAELNQILADDSEARVIVFTEYRDTQVWLAQILESRGLGGERLGLLYGGLDPKRRDHLKAAFQAAPHRHPLRILLATDSASEGIDLQNHCHRVIHYDIPFNPNRLEQRIGRVDRHGQKHAVDVAHFVGSTWEQAGTDSHDGDLEFLSRVAVKIATERRDLGSVNPVLAAAVEAKMLGRPTLIDPLAVEPAVSTNLLRAERDLREQTRRLRDQLHRSEQRLHVAPANVRRVVDTALALAAQAPLVDAGDGVIAPPELTSGWERTLAGSGDPLTGEPRPLTFDGHLAEGNDDVVHAHLEHPLVAQSSRLLRSAMWGGHTRLHRVAAVRVTMPEDSGLSDLLAVVFARLVVVGTDGRRLHEEVMPVARAIPATGRTRYVDLGQLRKNDPKEDDAKARLRAAIEDGFAPDACRPAPEAAQAAFAAVWPDLEPRLADDVKQAARTRLTDLERELNRRRDEELARVEGTFSHLEVTLKSVLEDPGFVQMTIDDFLLEERGQVDRDKAAWQARLEGIAEERERERGLVQQRYHGVRELVFPFAVALCVPDEWGHQ